jgi:hypothetical protein
VIRAVSSSPPGFSRGPIGLIGCLGLAVACGRGGPAAPVAPANTVPEGISIALYDRHDDGAYGLVDDRRWIDVTGDALVLEHVDPGAALPSLVIEPLDGGALDVGPCLRDRIPASPVVAVPEGQPPAVPVRATFAPALRCEVHAAHGRHLVRVLYVSPALGYRAQHDLAMTAPDRATITSRFAIVTPAWQARAEVTLFDGVPGGEQPPREVARGTILLDGGTAVLAVPPREARAALRRVYRGASQDDGGILRDSQPAVWVWLELDDTALALAPGPVHAHVALAGEGVRDVHVPAAGRRQAAAMLRLPLWIDGQLHGKRDHWSALPDGTATTDKLTVSVANTGTVTREVWIEERLRPARRRTVTHAWPSESTIVKNLLRMKLTVHAGTVEHAGVEITSEP